MRILVIGGGGREHALAWRCVQSDKVELVFMAPGNGSSAYERKIKNIAISATDIKSLLHFAQKNTIDLTIVGPEESLILGVVDTFIQAGLAIFGPTKNAAQLEGSKVFSKNFCTRNNIPSANYAIFTELEKSKNYVLATDVPIVIKADGLAAGKGVIIAHSKQEAIRALEEMLSKNRFGEAGKRVVIEEFLHGEEVSFIVMTDGKNILPMATSQDHKRLYDGDKGVNTGGMGAYSPAPIVTPKIFDNIMETIISPTIDAMAKEGMPYCGFLYAGLIIDKNAGVKVLEYNCRFGDPEAQPIMMRLKSDLASLCLLGVNGKLNKAYLDWDKRSALGVVLAAKNYPNHYRTGEIIHLPQNDDNKKVFSKIFHAGTTEKNNQLLTNGGRILCVTALGLDIKTAQKNAYALVDKIKHKNIYHYRRDIGFKALSKNKN